MINKEIARKILRHWDEAVRAYKKDDKDMCAAHLWKIDGIREACDISYSTLWLKHPGLVAFGY